MRRISLKTLFGFSPVRGSLHVFLLKRILPALAILLLSVTFLWPQFNPLETSRELFAKGVGPQVDVLRIVHPRYEGADKNGRTYTVIADEAVQKTTQEDSVRLISPHANVLLEGGKKLTATANEGFYKRSAEGLDLTGGIVLRHSDGHVLKTSFSHIDLKTGIASGDVPVYGTGPKGDIQAKAYRVYEWGKRIEFIGDVVITTPTEVVRGARGVYYVSEQKLLLEGNVRISHGANQLNGSRAEVDMKTGISRLLPDKDGVAPGRVKGLLVPNKTEKKAR